MNKLLRVSGYNIFISDKHVKLISGFPLRGYTYLIHCQSRALQKQNNLWQFRKLHQPTRYTE